MKYMEKSIEEIHYALENKEVTVDELIKESLEKSREVEEKYNAFVTILEDAEGLEVTDNVLEYTP